jgi:hypothetical protein
MDYWDLTYKASLTLCDLVLHSNAKKDGWLGLQEQYMRIWKRAGSPWKKKTELENLQILHSFFTKETPLKKVIYELEKELREVKL